MTTNVLNYHDDGANRQAQAALAMFQMLMSDGIEESWNETYRQYDARIKVARWENCREQGYVLSLMSNNFKRQLNIAFFEHRNVDGLCAVKWEQKTMNSPTIDTAQFGEVYSDKYDTSFDTNYGEVLKMAKWLHNEFVEFWKDYSNVLEEIK